MKNKSQRHKESNTFKFQPFAERIANINIDIFHRVGHEYETQDEEDKCLFYQAILKWDVLNLSEPYSQFRREVAVHNLITLPQLIHKKDHVAEVLLKHLRYKNILCLQALLDLVVSFANDLRKDFYQFYPDFFAVIIDLLNTKETDQLEWTFTCLAYLFKFLWRPLIKEVKTVFTSLLPLLSEHKPDYINDFAAQSFAFIVRKVKDWHGFLTLLLKVVRSSGDATIGCGKLLFEVINGVGGQFHSCAETVLPFLITSFEYDAHLNTVYEVVEEVVANICTRIKPQKTELFWKVCISAITNWFDIHCQYSTDILVKCLESSLKLLGQAIEYKSGKLLTSPVPIVNLIIRMLSFEGNPDKLLVILSQISILILVSENVRLPQEQASALISRVLSIPRILLHFVDHVKSYTAFEALVLPTFLQYCIANNLSEDCLRVLAKLILHKSPLCGSGVNLDSWVKYPLELKDANSRVLDLVRVADANELLINTDDYLCGLICLSHLNEDKVEVGEVLSNNMKLLCCNIEAGFDKRKQLYLLLVTLEIAVRVAPAGIVQHFDLIVTSVLPLCVHSDLVSALKVLDLYLSAISGDKLISFDLLLKLHQTLSVNFNSPFHEMRLHTAHIYTLFAHLPELNRDDAVEWKVFNLCYNVEAILPQVETYRDQLQNLEQLSFGKPQMNVCKETEFKTIPLRYLCGVLYMNFQLLWEPTIKIIATHADGLDLIDFCDVFLAELKASVVSVNEPLQRLENVLESDCEFLQDLYRSVNRLDMKPDFGNYRQLLWKALTYFPDVAERRTRDVSNLFLAFIEDEYVKANGEIAFRWNIKENESETSLNRNLDDTTEDDTSGKKSSAKLKGLNKLKILLHHLTIFNKVRNPKGMYREPELYKTYYDLLSHKNHDVQRLALDCIMTYKNKSLTPYREHLYNLINEKNVKEELATFRVDTDSSIVQTEHREHLIPVVLNIVYSKMFAKTGLRTGGKSSSQLRRNLVLRFLAGCERSEMLSFIRMTFRFYSKFFEDDLLVMCDNISRNVDLENVIPPKRLQSTLNLLTIVFEHFGGLGGDELLSFLLKVLFTIGATLKGVYRQLSAVHGGYLAILRNLRVSALKIVGRFFEHFETYPWSASEINSVFSVFVWPYLDKLTTEGIHSPTALLKLFVHWGSNPRYFPLLVKHQPGNLTQYVLPHVANLLINNQSNVSVKNVILEMFEKLLSFESNEDEAQLKIPVDDVLPIQEHILEKLKVRDLNYGSCIVLPHVPAVLEVIKRKLSAKFQKLNQREIFVLSRISELIWEPAISGEVLTLLLPLTLTKCSEGEELVMKYVTTVSNLLQNVTEPQQHLEQLSPLFAYVSYASCRKILSTSLETISKQSQDPKLSTLASVVGQLNACDEKFVDQPNFDRRLAGFKQVQLLIDGDALDLTLGVYVVYNCWYLLSNETDLSLKENAAHCWKNVSVILIKKYGDSAKELNYVLNDILFDIIRQGLKSKEDVCGECISLLGYLARECPTANVVLSDFNKIANKEDVEVDFFENLIHLQVHRQERALLKFCLVFNKAEAPHCRTLTQFVLPLTSIYLCSEKYSGNNKIINAAVKVLRTVCKLLPWHQYEGVLKFYVNKLHRDFVYQKQLVKIMVAILDAFHFDLSKGHVGVVKVERGDLKVMAKVEKTEVEGKIETGEDDGENNTSQDDETNAVKEEEMLEESVDEVEEVVKSSNSVLVLNRSSATKVIRTIQLVLLPQLHKALAEMTKHDKLHKVNRKKVSFEKEEEDLSRIPISLAVVKLLQQLPKEILDANIPRVFMKLCTFLKSHMENVRQVARETLQKIMLNLGPTYLPSLLNEMTSILSRGYQVHVLIFTVHAVLVSLKDKFRPTDIDAILLPVIDICKNELFGNMAEEKEVTQIVKKVSEAKSVKSFDTYHILAQYISDRCFLDLILSLKELLATSHSFKVINKVRECLRCIALGLVENTFISTESLLKFSYGTSSESIPELLSNTENLEPEVTGKQLLEKQKPDCFIIPPLPVGKSGIRLSGVKTSSKTNAHVLVEFGLNLCNHLLTKEKCKGDEFKPFLDPFIPIFKNCLSSRHVKLSTLTLQCLYRIMVYDLPSLRGNIKELTNIMFEILHKYASAGLGKGDNFDLVLAAFKCGVYFYLLLLAKFKMGNIKSEFVDEVTTDPWWQYDTSKPTSTKQLKSESKEAIMAEISTIHEKRIKLISEKKEEMNNLREEVARLKSENEQIKLLLEQKQQNTSYEIPGEDLRVVLDLQKKLDNANTEILGFEAERKEHNTHVNALKDIITVSKQLLLMKESQIKELSGKMEEIQSLAQKETEVLADDVRKDYEKQLKSMKQLKLLYEERQETQRKEISELKTKLNEATVDLNAEKAQNVEFQSQVEALEKDNSDKSTDIFNLESQLGLSKADCRELQSQLTVINQLFSQILTGFNNGQEINLDKLVRTLEENHDLLTDIVCNEECDEASSALPKVLLDLVNQVHPSEDANQNTNFEEAQTSEPSTLNSASEIVQNLPKVWRVLIELLSHQTAPVSVLNENDPNSCYKSVQTPAGPTLVLSVSKTYIRLKDLIVEKKSLEKETTRLKQLNTHLETRLQDQEKRLERVSQEVAKTWHVVGKMQKQHELLHTQENILRYELAQKRKLLNELKEELEYCREKWLQAREKNAVTEKQWKQLQSEFASRKRIISDDFNNSIESGYSDDRESSNSDSDEEHIQSFRKKRMDEANKDTEPCANILKVVQEEIANIESSSPMSQNDDQPKTELIEAVEKEEEEETDPIKIKHEDISNTYKRLEEHILETIKKTQNREDCASTSTFKLEEAPVEDLEHSVTEAVSMEAEVVNAPTTSSDKNPESMLSKREQRLQRLEEETKQLVGIVVKNAFRGEAFCSKLNMLHDRYGASTSTNDNSDSVVEEDVESSHEENDK